MGSLEHKPAEKEVEHPLTVRRNARVGLGLFAIYFAFYAGFVLVNTFRPEWMESTPLAGLNLAVLYGFGLIGGALVLSLIYGWLCRNPATDQGGSR